MVLFWSCSGLIFYILVGYPALLSLLARKHTRPLAAGHELRSVSVIIPVHNGARFLRRKLDSINALDYPKTLIEVLVVSDGSTDATEEIAAEYAGSGIKLLVIPRSGKAAALNAAAQLVSGEILVLTDVRQDLHPRSFPLLIAPFSDSRVGVVSGELLLREGLTQGEADVGLYWKYESGIRRNLSNLDSMFGATGPFYAIRRSLFTPIPEDILLDDVYLPMTAFFKGYRLIVQPEALAYDYPMTREREFNRKVRTLGGNYQLLSRMPALLTPANRLLWHFLSYKVGRLLLPWLLLLFVASTTALPIRWRLPLLLAQFLFILLAVTDPLVRQKTVLKKFSSPARTFLALMAATILGLRVLFVPARTLWKVTDIASDS
jgi:cellulose synthase/poly-beta-1,6-N-acetylglucosamine synthase-like glycosyltransferase